MPSSPFCYFELRLVVLLWLSTQSLLHELSKFLSVANLLEVNYNKLSVLS